MKQKNWKMSSPVKFVTWTQKMSISQSKTRERSETSSFSGAAKAPSRIGTKSSPLKPQETQRFSPIPEEKVSGALKATERICWFFSVLLVILFLPISIFFVYKVIVAYKRAVILRLGRMKHGGARGPGLVIILPCIDEYVSVDLRTVTMNVPFQEVLTRDSCTVLVEAVVFYRVLDPLRAVLVVDDYQGATRNIASTTLRTVISSKSLSEVLTQREDVATTLKRKLDDATKPWGVQVEHVELKDVTLPPDMQRAMAKEAEATREARAKGIISQGEFEAAKNLIQASNIITENPMALQEISISSFDPQTPN